MLRVYHLLIGASLMVVIPMGANFIRLNSANRNSLPSSSQAKNIINHHRSAPGNIWSSILGKTFVPQGWQVKACTSNKSLLCVSANGKNLGKVAIEVYPLEKRPNFQKMLAKEGITPGVSLDKQDPQYQTQILNALRKWVDTEYEILSQEHQQRYGNATKIKLPQGDAPEKAPQTTSINFAPQPPEVVRLGKLQGIRYGFAGLKPEGGVVEKYLQYVTFDGKAMYIIKTAFATDNIPSKFEKLENLAVFEPYLSAIVQNLQLPQQKSVVSSQ
ncbi:hypothetical protein [Calothrix rhizosoleniae]|uniref:hypothetical protein n=1 Tax=Calothrix rhizosoleniae TaxID=888997 RepID=UPI000B4A2B1D|nr:hypothetical protein [Calothrix rhizosoleniae]